MRIITAQNIEEAITFRSMIESLRAGFRSDIKAPVRHHHSMTRPDHAEATLLLMPAWTDFESQGHSDRGYIGVKIVSVFPDNGSVGLPSVMGVFVLMSGKTGQPLAMIDGQALTLWRTSCASALASAYLARSDARRLLMVGSGSLAPFLIRAHASTRNIEEVLIWNRTEKNAAKLAESLEKTSSFSVRATTDLEGATRGADIISCATLSKEPLIKGEWLKDGAHLDLVGAFRPDMRETDNYTMRKGRVFVDTRAGALAEAGDIVQPIESGALDEADIAADLYDLCRGVKAGRRFHNQITVFKSVGSSLEDLVAAQHIFLQV